MLNNKLTNWFNVHKTHLFWVGGVLFAIGMLVQLLYPADRLLPFAKVEGINMSAWQKKDAAWHLNNLSSNQEIAITLGNSDKPYSKVKPAKIGLKVLHNERISQSSYPWYLRIVPTSLLWFGVLQAEKPATYESDSKAAQAFLSDHLGESCNIPPKDATIKADEGKLTVVPAVDGGTCKKAQALTALGQVKPTTSQLATVKIPVEVTAANVTNAAAKDLADQLTKNSKDGITLEVANAKQVITQAEVLSWLVFSVNGKVLNFDVDEKKANSYFSKNVTPKISKPAGVTKVTTRDYTEVARIEGGKGQTLGIHQTVADVRNVLEGKTSTAKAAVVPVAPKVQYTRSYTKTSTGIAAMLQHYATDNPGTYGVSFRELGGRGLSASYNENQSFITASTYKLYVAYSVLKRIEKNDWKWSDKVTGGRNVSTCFDDMIVNSDNPCAEAMYKKIGYQTVINEARALGLSSTILAGDGQRTSAGDLTTFLVKLENKTLGLKDSSRSRLIDAMKRNVYRQGVPAGANGTVADKVGFLNGLLHDASIVYSPKGTYALTIMTNGSTWGKIAEITRKIEELR